MVNRGSDHAGKVSRETSSGKVIQLKIRRRSKNRIGTHSKS